MGDGTEFLRTEEEYQEDQQRFEAEVQQQQEHEETMTTNKKDFLNELVKKNHLNINEDIFRKAIRGKEMAFIKRSGIEKIQFTNDIRVKYEVIAMQPDYVVIKAIASMGTDNVFVESFGEATPENTNQKPPYYSAMAEKRALARVVLKICGAYKHGVYGEDEADDFKQPVPSNTFSKDIKGPDTQRKVA
jgi:hypothetical protein